jgi:NAD(P)-dependent dehydrogenase (short-subunit alcohol dehydrogenase family)
MALVARRQDALKAVAKAALCLGAPDVITLTADISDPDESKRVVDQTVKHFGKCKFWHKFIYKPNKIYSIFHVIKKINCKKYFFFVSSEHIFFI